MCFTVQLSRLFAVISRLTAHLLYHLLFSLSRTFLFYFFKFFSVVCFSNSDIISCLQFPVNTFFIFFSTLFNQFFVVCRKKSASFRSGFIISLFFLRVKHYFTFFYIFFLHALYFIRLITASQFIRRGLSPPDTIKSPPTAYWSSQLKQGAYLIRLKIAFINRNFPHTLPRLIDKRHS